MTTSSDSARSTPARTAGKRGRRSAPARVPWRLEQLEGREVPAAANLSAAAVSPSEVNLTWDLTDATDTAVVVERSTGTAGNYQVLATLPGGDDTLTDTSCWAATAYTYRVRTLTTAAPTPYTAAQPATTPATPA